jgi:hypothetical protein
MLAGQNQRVFRETEAARKAALHGEIKKLPLECSPLRTNP